MPIIATIPPADIPFNNAFETPLPHNLIFPRIFTPDCHRLKNTINTVINPVTIYEMKRVLFDQVLVTKNIVFNPIWIVKKMIAAMSPSDKSIVRIGNAVGSNKNGRLFSTFCHKAIAKTTNMIINTILFQSKGRYNPHVNIPINSINK